MLNPLHFVILICHLTMVATPCEAAAGPKCSSLTEQELAPTVGTEVLPGSDFTYGDRGVMPLDRDGGTSGLVFVEVMDREAGVFTRVYALYRNPPRWEWDHDSWFGPDGVLSSTIPPSASAAVTEAGTRLAERLNEAGCTAPPPLLASPYPTDFVPGAPHLDMIMLWWRFSTRSTTSYLLQKATASPVWAAGTLPAAAVITILVLILWGMELRRRYQMGEGSSWLWWSLWAYLVTAGALVALGCMEYRPQQGLSDADGSWWVHLPILALPPWWRLGGALIMLAGLFWGRTPGTSMSRPTLPSLPRIPPALEIPLLFLFSVCVTGALYLLRIHHEFFGDAVFFRSIFHQFGSIEVENHPLFWDVWTFLTAQITERSVETSMDLMRNMSAVAGVVYFLLLLHAARPDRHGPRTPRLSLVLALAWPGIQIFFFYPEVYSATLTAHLALLIAMTSRADRTTTSNLRELWILVFFVLAVEFHTVGFAMGPAVAWVVVAGLWKKYKAATTRSARLRFLALLLLCAIPAARTLGFLDAWIRIEGNWLRVGNFVGVVPKTNEYFARGDWLSDRISLLGWLAVPALILLPAALRGLMTKTGRALRFPAALAILPHLAYLGVWHCHHGACRDWDLFAVSGLVWLWFAGLAVSALPADHPARARVAPVAVAIGAAFTLCFILANASPNAPLYP